MTAARTPLIRLEQVRKVFKLESGLFAAGGRYVWAINGVSLDIGHGETYGLVGESGSGKTTLARTIVQLVPHTSGSILYYPSDDRPPGSSLGLVPGTAPWEISRRDPRGLRRFRAQVKYVFQDPSSSLDPRMSVESILTAGARYAPDYMGSEAVKQRAKEVMIAVGLRAADLSRRPAEFSGGQRQRISLARALFGNPRALICDEVVSALDVSIQGQILNLLVDLKRAYDLTILFIAHDLTVVSYMADRIGVLYGGSLMEEAPARNLARRPLHPYTQLLYASIPRLDAPAPGREAVAVAPAATTHEPVGCPFRARCPLAREVCDRTAPELRLPATS
jgi:oligopeptide/dipeptide ABC transporter ATP-binding protein